MCFLFLSGHGRIDPSHTRWDLQNQPGKTDYSVFFPVDEEDLLYFGHGNSIVLTALKCGAKELKDMLTKNPATQKLNKSLAKSKFPDSPYYDPLTLKKRDLTKITDHLLSKCLPEKYETLLFLKDANEKIEIDPEVFYKTLNINTDEGILNVMRGMFFTVDENLLRKAFVAKLTSGVWAKSTNLADENSFTFELPAEAIVQAFLNQTTSTKKDELKLSTFMEHVYKMRIACILKLDSSKTNVEYFSARGCYIKSNSKTSKIISKQLNPSSIECYVEFKIPPDTSFYWDACRA